LGYKEMTEILFAKIASRTFNHRILQIKIPYNIKIQFDYMNTSFRIITIFAVVWITLLLPLKGISQIQGSIWSTNNKPLSYANVMLLNKNDSSVVTGNMATEEGAYTFTNLKPGEYIIAVRSLGYKSAFSPPFEVKTARDHIHNEPIFVVEDSQNIQEVNVIAKKPVYELQIDRMVVNVENSITSTGNTALEVLEKSPGIIVDRQNSSIAMGGKQGVIVMINGKQSRMPMAAAFQMLNSMSSDNVKKIELITTPPARYDAEGDAGIINIVMKKNENFGTNGSFTMGAGVAAREKMEGSLNLNHHVDKINYYVSYNANFNNTRQQIDSYRRFLQSGSVLESDGLSKREAIVLFQNIRMGFDYTITSKTMLSFLGTGYVRDWEADALNTIFYNTDNVLTRKTEMTMFELNKWIHGMGNINLLHHIKEDEIIDINIDYLNYYNRNPSKYTVENLDNAGQLISGENIDVKKITPINIFVGMLDYSKQINPKLKIEAGIKGTLSLFNNDIGVSYFTSGRWEADPEMTNEYSLNENISAAYSSLSYKMNDKTSLIIGLRYEYMNSVLSSETEKGIVDLHYGELFPSFYFSRKLNEHNTVQLSYSRRIDRPTFNELAPFIVFMSPETFLSGNEGLLPAFSNILKTDYQYKSLMLSFSFTDTKNAISRFQPRHSEDDSKQYFTSRNLDNVKTYSAMMAFPVKITDWWKMQNNINLLYQNLNSDYDGTYIDFNQYNYRLNSIQTMNITKELSAEVSGFYQSQSLSGVAVSKPTGRLDLGLQWKFRNERSRLNVNLNDAFKTNIWRSSADIPELNIYSRWRLDFEPRVLRVIFTHSFGGATSAATRTRRTASEEERRRISN
jgi:outer membrane receptor protein involved in Fe transport